MSGRIILQQKASARGSVLGQRQVQLLAIGEIPDSEIIHLCWGVQAEALGRISRFVTDNNLRAVGDCWTVHNCDCGLLVRMKVGKVVSCDQNT